MSPAQTKLCIRTPVARPRDEHGFALVSVLLLGLIVGGILLGLQLQIRQSGREAANHEDEIELAASLSAGLNRMIFAYAARDDALRPALVADGRQKQWPFGSTTLLLSVRAESGKWDLNAGDRNHIATLVDRLFPEQAGHVMDQIDRARSARQRLTSVAAVLKPWDRMTERRTLFERYFTVATEQNGIDPLTAPADTLLAMPEISSADVADLLRARSAGAGIPDGLSGQHTRLFAGEKPVYTFRAETTQGFRHHGAMEALVSFSESGSFTIFSWSRVALVPGLSSDSASGPPTSAALSLP